MNKKRLICIIVAIALVAVLIPSVYAYMVRRSQTVANTFVPGKVTCDIEEKFESNVKSEIKVENTGNVKAYIRVRLVFHWEDSKGYPVGINMDLSKHPVICYTGNNENWIQGSDAYTYYYKVAVEPGQSTTDLLKNDWTMKGTYVTHEGVNYYYYPVMEVLAEAIQADGEIDGTPAVTNAWGVTIDSTGKITAVP